MPEKCYGALWQTLKFAFLSVKSFPSNFDPKFFVVKQFFEN